jgi:hypothetical protein
MSGECFEWAGWREPQWYGTCSSSLTITRCANVLKKSRSYLKILDARRVTCSRFRAEDPQILGAMVQNFVATATRRSGLVHPYEVWSCSWWWWWWWWFWLWFLVVVVVTVWDFRRRWLVHPMVSVRHNCHVALQSSSCYCLYQSWQGSEQKNVT